MTRNPWLEIPLGDYEGHMALPQVAQAGLLADVFELMLTMYAPESVAVLCCAGGNGFERVDPKVTGRVVGIDINPAYLAQAAERWRDRLPGVQFLAGDIAGEPVPFEPVSLIYAALVFEYVDLTRAVQFAASRLQPGGRLCSVIQLPSATVPEITPSRFTTLSALSGSMRLVAPGKLQDLATANGLTAVHAEARELPSGKRFQLQVFQR